MKKQLFFDDNKLFVRENVTRKYGRPQLIADYSDGSSSTDYPTGYVFRLDNGKYRMLYYAHSKVYSDRKLLSAISDDGVHFSPEPLFPSEKEYPHEIMSLKGGDEIAFIYEDKHCSDKDDRYKLLMSEFDGDNLQVNDTVFTSPDLINWSKKEGVFWGDGTEPLASVFYNEHKKVHTIIERPFWGIRYAGLKETADWQTFTEYQPCLNVDSLDEPLAEVYGMFAFEYEGMYIGLPHLYRNLKNELHAKFFKGTIDTQLAYSYDGRYWNRSLREPFLSGITGETETEYKMIWCFGMANREDCIHLYSAATELEHGPAFREPGTGKMLVWNLRKDGFVMLTTNKADEPACIATREKVWHSGEAHYNLKAESATVAVYITDESENVGGNVYGFSRVVDGMDHEDCIPFSGDSTDWVPEYFTGKKISDLCGKTLVYELKFLNGEVYSFAGDFTDVYNTQGARYRKFGVLPK